MTQVLIPFNQWSKDRLNTHGKCCTSRVKQYGTQGDIFIVQGVIYEIAYIMPNTMLKFVKEFLYKLEGANSPEEFEQVWNSLHPIKKFQPTQGVYVHFFRLQK